MHLATETHELANLKTEKIHQIFLCNLLKTKGLDKALMHRSQDDIDFIEQIKDKDLYAVHQQLQAEFFEL